MDKQISNDWCYEGDDLGFSSSPCDCCDSHLGGTRYKASQVLPDNRIIYFAVCTECINLIANGE